VLVSDTPPVGAADGALWFESDTGLLFLRFNDGTSTQWVIAAPQPDASSFVAKSGDTMTGNLTIANPVGPDIGLNLSKPASSGFSATIYGRMNGLSRWAFNMSDASPESGSNAGSNFSLSRYNDLGNYIDSPLALSRATGLMTATNLTIKKAASSSVLTLDKAAGGINTSYVTGLANGLSRWTVELGNNNPEGSGNIGSDFAISRFDNTGNYLNSPMNIERSNGRVNISGSGGLRLLGGSPGIVLDKSGGTYNASIQGWSNGVPRWVVELGNGGAGETGGNAGSIFGISRYADNGANLGTPFQIDRASGQVSFSPYVVVNGSALINQAVNQPFLTFYSGGYQKILRMGGTYELEFINSANSAMICSMRDDGEVTAGRGFTSYYGYRCRYGTPGGLGDNYFNLFYSSGVTYLFVDQTNFGYINTTSDYRTKKDVGPLPSMWETVKALRPIQYTQAEFSPPSHIKHIAEETAKAKQEAEANPEVKPREVNAGPLFPADNIQRWGFIAHELQETLVPSAATGVKDSPDHIQAPNPFTLIAALTKALQEAMTRIETLEAKVNA
jgi:hypothetical protein